MADCKNKRKGNGPRSCRSRCYTQVTNSLSSTLEGLGRGRHGARMGMGSAPSGSPESRARPVLTRNDPRPILPLRGPLPCTAGSSPRAAARVCCSTGLLISTGCHSLSQSVTRTTGEHKSKKRKIGMARENLLNYFCRDTKTSPRETWARGLLDV